MSSTVPPDSELLLETLTILRESGYSRSELLAIRLLLQKMRSGSAKHGSLDLTSDGRNWIEEKRGELADWLWYDIFAEVQAGLKGTV